MRKYIIRLFIFLAIIISYIFTCTLLCKNVKTDNLYKVNDNKNRILSNVYSSNNDENEYYAKVNIPKINLSRYLYPIDSSLNTVDKNVEILKGSSMPDINSGNLILAAHNGLGSVAYFHNLHKLEIGDEVLVSYNKIDYRYVVSDIYDVLKTGKVKIKRDKSQTTITMITCLGNDRQLVVIGYLR